MARRRQGPGETLSGSPIGQFTNFSQKPIQARRAPTLADTGYELGQLWVDSTTGLVFTLGKVGAGIADWGEINEPPFTSLTFRESPVLQSSSTTGGPPTGASGDLNIMALEKGIIMEQFMIGNQAVIAPRMSQEGLVVSLDQVAFEGAEYNFGANRENARHTFLIGTSPAFFFEVELDVEDVSGAGPFVIGFRSVQANNNAITTYSQLATIGLEASVSTTDIIILAKEMMGSFTNTTDPWGGDGASNTLRVEVSEGGAATFGINGRPPTVTKSMTFTQDDFVAPFMYFLQAADVSIINLLSMKVGFIP